MKYLLFFLSFIVLISCQNKPKIKAISKEIVSSQGKNIEVYDFDNFQHFLNQQNDTTYVVNFWATWCKPCIDELPAFQKLSNDYQNDKVKVILVSLDFPGKIENNVIPFIIKNKVTPKVIVLDDPDQNSWIPKVSEDWLGSIPATVIYKNDKKAFYEQSFTYEELNKELLKIK